MNEKRLVLYFSGSRDSLYKQFKIWCAENDTDMNKTLMSLIEKHLKKENNKLLKREILEEQKMHAQDMRTEQLID